MPKERQKPVNGFFSNQDPKLKPLWVRLSIIGAVAAWGLFEVYMGLEMWAFIAGAALMYCVWSLLLAYVPPPDDEDTDPQD